MQASSFKGLPTVPRVIKAKNTKPSQTPSYDGLQKIPLLNNEDILIFPFIVACLSKGWCVWVVYACVYVCGMYMCVSVCGVVCACVCLGVYVCGCAVMRCVWCVHVCDVCVHV